MRSITFLIGGVVGCLLGGLLMGQPGYLPWGWIFFGALAAGITSATTWRRDRR